MTDASLPAAGTGLAAEAGRPSRFLGRLLRKPLAIAALGWLALIAIASAFAGRLAPYDPLDQDLLAVKQSPSADHWLGTDALGRDVLSRLLFGGSSTLVGIAEAVVVASALGVGLGVAAGYFGGWLDRAIIQLVDLVLSLPTIVILLSVLAVFHHDMVAAMVAVGLLGSAGMIRVIRSATLAMRGALYVEAARICGLGDGAIILRHVIPRILGPVLVQISLFAAVTVLIQTGISFLGLGVPPPDPSWGGMIADASESLNDFPWLLIPSGAVAALTILAFGLLGDSARDAAAEGWSPPVATRRSRRVVPAPVDSAADPGFDPAALLSIRGLTIALRVAGREARPLVDDLSLDLAPGETLGIVGESGSGKTMTILSLLGLLPPGIEAVSGAMAIEGRQIDLRDGARVAQLRGGVVSMIFQEPMSALDPCFTVGQHLAEVDSSIREDQPIRRPRPRDRAARAGPDSRPGRSDGPLPAPDFRGHGAARRDRAGFGAQAEDPARGRTDDRARRHGPGRDPRVAARARPAPRHGDHPGDPRLGRGRRPLRPRGGAVQRRDAGMCAGGRIVQPAAPSLYRRFAAIEPA